MTGVIHMPDCGAHFQLWWSLGITDTGSVVLHVHHHSALWLSHALLVMIFRLCGSHVDLLAVQPLAPMLTYFGEFNLVLYWVIQYFSGVTCQGANAHALDHCAYQVIHAWTCSCLACWGPAVPENSESQVI